MTGQGTGDQYGIRNQISNLGDANHYGTYNMLNGTGSGDHYATYNSIRGDGTGKQFGVRNVINNSGSGAHYGNYSSLNDSGTGVRYGTYNNIRGTGTGNKYGTYNNITSTGSGTQIAVYGKVKNGQGNYAGRFDGNVRISKKLKAPASGNADMKAYVYGSIASSGSFATNGTHSSGFLVSKTGTGEYKITFTATNKPTSANQYTVIANLSSGDNGFITVENDASEFTIKTSDTSGTAADKAFNFVVYKK